jgi:hypothetical protein
LVLLGQIGNFRRGSQVAAQIVLFERRFGEIHGTDRHPRESRRAGREWHGSEKMLEVREHVFLAEVAHPDARISTVWHPDIIQAPAHRAENNGTVHARKRKI